MAKETKKDKLIVFSEAFASFVAAHPLRNFPWRKTRDPYKIMVSEIMLQQTQAERVIEKYQQFLGAFPTLASLAEAPPALVLRHWSGLGYNRRALYLRRAAQEIIERYGGVFPKDCRELQTLPGIGPYTARAICTFAFNLPDVFIETNIRSVYLEYFFKRARVKVPDSRLIPLISATLDKKNPRQFYNVLMDWGAFLKKSGNMAHQKSRHYVKQTAFHGSRREVRGAILKLLSQAPQTTRVLQQSVKNNPHSVADVLNELKREGFISNNGSYYSLTEK